jgi:hypothetical protein
VSAQIAPAEAPSIARKSAQWAPAEELIECLVFSLVPSVSWHIELIAVQASENGSFFLILFSPRSGA